MFQPKPRSLIVCWPRCEEATSRTALLVFPNRWTNTKDVYLSAPLCNQIDRVPGYMFVWEVLQFLADPGQIWLRIWTKSWNCTVHCCSRSAPPSFILIFQLLLYYYYKYLMLDSKKEEALLELWNTLQRHIFFSIIILFTWDCLQETNPDQKQRAHKHIYLSHVIQKRWDLKHESYCNY
jgi:hypothetical protein